MATNGIMKYFDKGIKAIATQEEKLEDLGGKLVQRASETQSKIDTAVKDWQKAKEAVQQAKDNQTWLEIEIERDFEHSFSELSDLYQKHDEAVRYEQIFDRLEWEKKRPALDQVHIIVDEFQDALNGYSSEIDELQDLIDEHGTESTEDELQDLVHRYSRILNNQVKAVNKHLNTYDIDNLVR